MARTAGALFIRTYERGERVYVAMLARGYGGNPTVDAAGERRGTAASWGRASRPLPALASVVCVAAVVAA